MINILRHVDPSNPAWSDFTMNDVEFTAWAFIVMCAVLLSTYWHTVRPDDSHVAKLGVPSLLFFAWWCAGGFY